MERVVAGGKKQEMRISTLRDSAKMTRRVSVPHLQVLPRTPEIHSTGTRFPAFAWIGTLYLGDDTH